MRERMSEADGGEFEEDDDSSSLSPAEKRALDAERRAEWRKARLRSLENVSNFGTIDHCSNTNKLHRCFDDIRR